ncbi:hypothetical protein PLESTB_001816700 [Pleodorina starrii]|uniref:F-box protein n=1 Tax=Pleodorina starrii TaxID=330485 RepID=A0A9W6FAP6_9CHLO|nr:hypothetical protein PLESTM_001402800 [Pleodorina starrii]GLC61906.1 hypothetical protein PLESTB_001816700 [Pleodorina starrii]GLC75894.1 hypothetical protein PLESTF_001703400 [Pleodorina starrii]
MPFCNARLVVPGPEDDGMVPLGLIHILVQLPYGYARAAFRFGGRSLTVNDGDTNLDVSAYGVRSTELLAAVARLEAKKRVGVTVRLLALAPPAEGAAAAPAAADSPPSLPYLPPLPAGIALLELRLKLPKALWSYEELHVRRWLHGDCKKPAVMILGAIVPMGEFSTATGSESSGSGGPSTSAAAAAGDEDAADGGRHRTEQLIREAVEDLLEQHPPGWDRERYSLISCFKELPSVTRLYDRTGGVRKRQPVPQGAPTSAGEGDQHLQPKPQQQSLQGGLHPGNGAAERSGAAGTSGPSVMTHGSLSLPPPASEGTVILDLPVELLQAVISRLGPLDLARLRATCTALADAGAAGGAVPGVQLTLFPHQRAAISWMIRRERADAEPTRGSAGDDCYIASPAAQAPLDPLQPRRQSPRGHPHNHNNAHCSHDQGVLHSHHLRRRQHHHLKHPCQPAQDKQQLQSQSQQQQQQQPAGPCRHPMFIELRGGGGGGGGGSGGCSGGDGCGFGLWADVGSGELRTSPPPPLPQMRGGFFCDEPGLGKTVTALSLVLKTLGQLPTPPPGATVKWIKNREGKTVGLYTTDGGAGGAAGAAANGGSKAGNAAAAATPGTPNGRDRARRGRAAEAAATPATPADKHDGDGVVASASTSFGMRRGARLGAVDAAASAASPRFQPRQGEEQGAKTTPRTRGRRQPPQPSPAAQPSAVRSSQQSSPPARQRRQQQLQGGDGASSGGGGGARGRGGKSRGGGRGGRPAKRRRGSDGAGWESGESEGDGGNSDESDEPEEEEVEEKEEEGRSDGEEEEEEEEEKEGAHSDGSEDDYKPGMKRRRRRSGRGRGGPRGGSRAGGAAAGRRTPGKRSGSVGSKGTGRRKEAEEEEEEGGSVDGKAGKGQVVQQEAEVEAEAEEAIWVQCEQCQAWRKLPEGTPAPSGDGPWFCHLHPLPEAASCTAPRESYGEDDEFHEAPGYLRPGDGPAAGSGSAGESRGGGGGNDGDGGCNLDYFLATLRSVAGQLGLDPRALASMRALRWLTQQNPASLRSNTLGVMVPLDVRRLSPEYDIVFRALDLVNVADGAAGGGGGAGGRRRRRGGGGGGAAEGRGSNGGTVSALHTWRAAPYMAQLVLDVEALGAALAALGSGPCGSALHLSGRTYLSAATLVVLPATIIDHWLLQIRTHVARDTLRVCVLDRIDPRVTPSPSSLAWDYDLVITTFNPLSYGRAATAAAGAAAALGSGGGSKKAGGGGGGRKGDRGGGGGACGAWLQALNQVHWLRIILDEGHLLGATTSITNKLQAAVGLRAERRWVMTGTPTPATHGSSAAHLQPLLAFLHYDPYGTNSATWQAAVQRPLEACRPEGRRRLMRLLREIMIRASKSDLALLPRLVRKVTLLDFEPQHAKSYNALVEVVRRNLLTSDWGDESHRESLLSSANGKWSRQMMNNVWLSCCVAGSTNSVVKEADLLETLQLLAGRLGLPEPGEGLPAGVAVEAVGPPWLGGEHPLRDVEEGLRRGTQCQVCGEFVRQPMVTPCGHLACLDCTASDRERCPLPSCRTPYVMQPVNDPARSKHNRNPKWPVPQELIEWQPVYHQQDAVGIGGGSWSATWQLTRSSKISHMLKRLREIGAAPPLNPPPPPPPAAGRYSGGGGGGGDSQSAAAPAAAAAAAAGAGPHRDDSDGAGAGPGQDRSHTDGGGGGGAPAAADDAAAAAGGSGGGVLAVAAARRFVVRRKAIVFTQHGVHMQLIESSLREADIPHEILTQVIRKELREVSLSRFQHDPHCGVLIMDQLGAVGLDLSFASYVLLMEPLADTSLEQQVVSRAHRMGAKKDVEVETLVMRGSAEEALMRLDRKSSSSSSRRGRGAAATAAAAAGGGGGLQAVAAAAVEAATAAAAVDGMELSAGGSGGGSGGGGGVGGGGGDEVGGGEAAAAAAVRRPESTAEDPRVAEDLEGGVQVDRRALRNQLFLLLEKVRLGRAANGNGTGSGNGGCAGGSGGGGAGTSSPTAAARRSGDNGAVVGTSSGAVASGSSTAGASAGGANGGGCGDGLGGCGTAPQSGATSSGTSAAAATAAAATAAGSSARMAAAAPTATGTAPVGPAVAAAAEAATHGAADAATVAAAAMGAVAAAAAAAAAEGAEGAAPEGQRQQREPAPKRRRVRFAGEDGE